jgi:uncharacterized protein with ParB-like and HNH nuclease domain
MDITLKPINDLLGKKFFIPSYQRGYRWDTQQVEDLLNDIWEFREQSENAEKSVFYCLQPLVIARQNDEYILIDGQQRLTTIYLILTYLDNVMAMLGKEKYSIKYETRTDSEAFLFEINQKKKYQNIDYYHICEAYETIKNWFDKKDGVTKMHFLTTLLNPTETGKNVQVIWYEVESENSILTFDHIEVFTRINMGKIRLTNAELIKALFLRKANFNENEVYLKQLQIASEWDSIEQKLQDNSFWYFLTNEDKSDYPTRIEYIFDLMKNKAADQVKRVKSYRLMTFE